MAKLSMGLPKTKVKVGESATARDGQTQKFPDGGEFPATQAPSGRGNTFSETHQRSRRRHQDPSHGNFSTRLHTHRTERRGPMLAARREPEGYGKKGMAQGEDSRQVDRVLCRGDAARGTDMHGESAVMAERFRPSSKRS